jgi:hypothetical protein
MSNLFILENVDESTKAKLTRIFKGMRQVDVAAAAHVDIVDVTGLEYFPHTRTAFSKF